MSDSWMETCLVSIAAQSGTDIPFQSLTETVDVDLGEKDIEGVALVNGGRMTKFTPEGDTSITLEAYPLEAGSGDISSATAGAGFYDLLQAEDTTQPLAITNTTARSKYRMAILWTDDTAATNAAGALSSSNNKGFRITGANGYITSVKPSFTDGVLKFTIAFKVAAFTKAGNSQILVESTDGTATLTALQSYTSSTRW